MKESVNVHEAKTHFSRLLARVNQGEEIIIAKAGKPVARLVPYASKPSKRVRVPPRGKFKLRKILRILSPRNLLKLFES